jgi:hypothetical protein
MRKRKPWWVAVVLLLTVACGEAEAPADKAAALDPCRLVTRAEAAQALGQEVGPAERRVTGNALGQVICLYPAAQEGELRFVQVSLVCDRDLAPELRQAGYSAARLFADTRKLLKRAQAVEGLGAEAFWGGSGLKAGAGLHLLASGVYLNLTVASGDPRRDLAAARELAARILQRLEEAGS